jgi:hypothetical protein
MKCLFEKKKIIYFIHVYKTGGTTVKDLLHRNYSGDQIANLYYSPWGSSGHEEEFQRLPSLLEISKKTKVVYGHYLYGLHKNLKRPYKYYVFLRDPLQRIISTYYHLKRLDKEWQFRILRYLDERINSINDLDTYFPDIETYLDYKGIQNQQCMFLTGYMPEKINQDQKYYAKIAIENIKRDFAFTGVTEFFQESLGRLQSLLGLESTDFEYKNLGDNKPKIIDLDNKVLSKFYENSLADTMIYDFVKERYYSKSVI